MSTSSALTTPKIAARQHLRLHFRLALRHGTAALLLCLAGPAAAEQFVVNTAADVGDADPGDGMCATEVGSCSLRAAIQEANALDGEEIVLLPPPPATDRYRLTILGPDEDNAATGDLDITDDLVLSGEGSGLIVIQGTVTDRVFDVFAPATVRIENLGIEGGRAAPQAGGGIRNRGDLSLEAVTLHDNAAVDGAGIANIEDGDIELVNATVSGNTATGLGGGIANFDDATATLLNVTVADNQAAQGSGLHNLSTIELQNTIVAQNAGQRNCAGSLSGIVSLGNNLESANTCFLDGDDDLPNAAPALALLSNNGGNTRTHALLPGSAAIDAANDAACPQTDQRGAPRPFDGDASGTPACDIGALEAGAPLPPTPTATATASPTPTGTLVDTASPTITPTETPVSPTPTGTLPTRTPTETASPSPTPTTTNTPTATVAPPSATPTLTRTATPVLPTATSTRTPVPPTATATPDPVQLVIRSATGRPGQRVSFDVVLRTGDFVVGSVQHDVGFDSLNTPLATLPGGAPDCELNPQIGKTSVFLLRPQQCTGVECDTLFAAVFSVQPPIPPIPDDTVLYICGVNISPTAEPGEYPLSGSRIVASDPNGFGIAGAVGIDGAIVVQPGPTRTPTPQPCVGDCNGDGEVTVDEIVTMVNVALGRFDVDVCPAADRNDDGEVTVDEILLATNNALRGCASQPAASL